MSRTYRRRTKGATKNWKHTGPRKHRSGDAFSLSSGMPPCYRNAKRMRCVSAGSTKWWFHSKEAALEAAKYNRNTREENSRPYKYERAYFCHTCNGFHLTTFDRDGWQSRKAELARLQGLELDDKGNFTKRKPLDRFPDRMD